jgi:hypothetical protein
MEKNTVKITRIKSRATIKMLTTSANQPGIPRFVNRLGTGRTVMVITAASRMGLMMEAELRIPNKITTIQANPTR